MDETAVFLSGVVAGQVRFQEREARFGLRCADGLFSVRVFDAGQVDVCRALRQGDRVTVAGALRSFVFRRCSSHHAWVRAVAVLAGDRDLPGELPALVALVTGMAGDEERTDVPRLAAQAALAGQTLREIEERCRIAAEAIAAYPYTLRLGDEAPFVAQWLGALAPLTGFSAEEVGDAWTRLVAPDDVARVSEHLRAITSGQSSVVEFRVVSRGGEARWIRDHVSPAREGGASVRVHGVGQDVTDRKWLETQTLELQRMAVVNRLVGGVAHEFNNLLTIIMSHAELTLYRLGQEGGDRVRQDVAEIVSAAERAAWLTHQLLAFSRRRMVLPELLDLNGVVANLAEMLRRVVSEDVELSVEPGYDAGYARADQGQVEQIVINLAVYACERMPAGGRLTIRTGNVSLDEMEAGLAGIPPGAYVRLEVSDSGPEVDAAELARLRGDFDERGDVGWPMAYRMSSVIGAQLLVSDPPGGRGVTFSLYLPRVSDVEVVAAVRQARVAPPRPETVLVVEDEDRVRSLTGHVLQINGYTVLEARSAEEALAVCRQHAGPVHLVVTDVMLPGMDGVELVGRLAGAYPQLRAILVSGYVDAGVTLDQAPAEASFLRKPFSPADLMRYVHLALGGEVDEE